MDVVPLHCEAGDRVYALRTLKTLIGFHVCTRRNTLSSSNIRSNVRASREHLASDSKNPIPIQNPPRFYTRSAGDQDEFEAGLRPLM